jgi:hypothetical protein
MFSLAARIKLSFHKSAHSPYSVTFLDCLLMESGRDAIGVTRVVIVGVAVAVDIAEIRVAAVPVIRGTLPPVVRGTTGRLSDHIVTIQSLS